MTSVEPSYHTYITLPKLFSNSKAVSEFITLKHDLVSTKCMSCAKVTVDRILKDREYSNMFKSFVYLTTDGVVSIDLYQRKGSKPRINLVTVRKQIQMQLRRQFTSCFLDHVTYEPIEFECAVCGAISTLGSTPILYKANECKIFLKEAVCPNCKASIDLNIVKDSYSGVKDPSCFLRSIATVLKL